MSADFWFIDRENSQQGPVAKDKLVNLIRDGIIGEESQIWTNGMKEWRKAGEVEDFSSVFPPPPPVLSLANPKAIKFNILSFRAVMLWCAIIGLLGNQTIFGIETVIAVNEHNSMVTECRSAYQETTQDHNNSSATDEEKGKGLLALACMFSDKDMNEWEIDYGNVFINPIFTFSLIGQWHLLNHILAWGGLALGFMWIVLKLSVRP